VASGHLLFRRRRDEEVARRSRSIDEQAFRPSFPWGKFAMLAILLAAALRQADPAPSSSTASPPSPSPIREVVFKFSDDETNEYTTDQGSIEYTTDQLDNGLAAPPESQKATGGYSGTMTVDILQVDATSGFLKAAVHEATDAENGKTPFDAVFIVHPDGALTIVSGSYDADMTGLMPYFATSYFADRLLQQGIQWESSSKFDKTPYTTTTTVVGVNGDDVSLKAVTKAPGGLGAGDLVVDTALVYDAPKLVPVTLDILATRRGSGDTSSAEQISHYHFDRISDTLDATTSTEEKG
jgi:hypothetical protein